MAKKKAKVSKKSGNDIVTVAGVIEVNDRVVKLTDIEDVKVLLLLVKSKGEKNWTVNNVNVYSVEKEKWFRRQMIIRTMEGDEVKVVICTTMVESTIELDEVPFIESEDDNLDGLKVNVPEDMW